MHPVLGPLNLALPLNLNSDRYIRPLCYVKAVTLIMTSNLNLHINPKTVRTGVGHVTCIPHKSARERPLSHANILRSQCCSLLSMRSAQEHERVVALAPKVLLAVLKPHLEAVDAALAPGLGLLTWTSLNIDGYLHRVHQVRMLRLPLNPAFDFAQCQKGSKQVTQHMADLRTLHVTAVH